MELTHSASHLLICTASFVPCVLKENIFHFFGFFLWVSMRVHEKMSNKTIKQIEFRNKDLKMGSIWGLQARKYTHPVACLFSLLLNLFWLSRAEREKKVFPVSDKLSKVQTFPLIVAGKMPLSAEARLADVLRSTFSCRQKDWVTSALRVNTCAMCPSCRFTRVFNIMHDDRFIFFPATTSENSEIKPKPQELCERASEKWYLHKQSAENKI